MMKKISRRSFLRVCGITAATAALTACGGGKTETAKKDDAHEAITFMAFVHSLRFAFRLAAAAGSQRRSRSRNAANPQKRAAGDLFHHTNIFLTFSEGSTTQVQ